MQERIAKWIYFVPYFLGPLAGSVPFEAITDQYYVKRYLSVLLLFGIWYGVRLLLIRELLSTSADSRKKNIPRRPSRGARIFSFGRLAVGALFALSALVSLHFSLPTGFFALVIAALLLKALADLLRIRSAAAPTFVISYLGHCSVGYLTLQLPSLAWLGPPLLISAGVSCYVLLIELAPFLKALKKRYPRQERNRTSEITSRLNGYSRAFLALIAMGPSLVAIPGFFRQLPLYYSFIVIIIPISNSLYRPLTTLEGTGELPEDFSRETASLVLLFIVMIVVLGIV